MNKTIALALCLFTFLYLLSGCSFEINPKSGFTGVEHSNNPKITSAETPQSPDQTLNSNDAISIKALEGDWYWYDGWYRAYLWIFSVDGSYARFKVSQTSFSIFEGGGQWESAYGNIMVGNYRVNGHVIECYNNQHSSQFKTGYNLPNSIINMTANELANTPLDEPSNAEEFIIEFEFTDAMTLRLIVNRENADEYDSEFEYRGSNNRNMTIPEHLIPSREWPKAYTKIGIPEYVDGRVRLYENAEKYEEVVWGVRVRIDHTTPEYFNIYIENLLQSGWEIDNDWGTLYDNGYVYYNKDGYTIGITSHEMDSNSNGKYTIFRRILEFFLFRWDEKPLDDLLK